MDREAGNMLAGIGGNFRERIFFRRVKEDCYLNENGNLLYGNFVFRKLLFTNFLPTVSTLRDINFGIKIID